MKTIFCLVAIVFCLARIHASILKLNGDLTWNVTEPQCAFKLEGDIQNLSGVATGTIKLVLWATPNPYPSAGYIVGEYTFGQLPAGTQFSDFTVKTRARVPVANGSFYFTIAVVEYTSAGWRNVLLVPTGTKALYNGDFVKQAKWVMPFAPVVAPPPEIAKGDVINLLEQATGEFNKFPLGWREKIALTARRSGEMKFANNNRDATVDYNYSVQKTTLRNRRVAYGKLVLTFGGSDELTFKNSISLYFQGPNYGTYKSVVTGSLWSGTLDSATTWGSFKLQ